MSQLAQINLFRSQLIWVLSRQPFAEIEAEIDRPREVSGQTIRDTAANVHRTANVAIWILRSALSRESIVVAVTDIWEVATFYSRSYRPGRQAPHPVCRTLSQYPGSKKITEHCSKKFGIKVGETTADGRFTLSEVECLGSCGTAPMLQLNFDYHEDLTPKKVDQILDALP